MSAGKHCVNVCKQSQHIRKQCNKKTEDPRPIFLFYCMYFFINIFKVTVSHRTFTIAYWNFQVVWSHITKITTDAAFDMLGWRGCVQENEHIFTHYYLTKTTANYSQAVTAVPLFPLKLMKVLSPCQKAQPARFSFQHLLLQTFDVLLILLSPSPLTSFHSMCSISWKQPVSSNDMDF